MDGDALDARATPVRWIGETGYTGDAGCSQVTRMDIGCPSLLESRDTIPESELGLLGVFDEESTAIDCRELGVAGGIGRPNVHAPGTDRIALV